MFHSIVNAVSGSAWTYAIVFGVSALDAFFPLVPSETTVIAAGVLAANGDLRIELIVPAAAIGAVCGDNVSFWIGRTLGERIAEKLFAGKRRRHLDRAHRMLEERGGYLIVIARFIPGGRTAATFAAGSLDWEWRRFIKFDLAAGAIWAAPRTPIRSRSATRRRTRAGSASRSSASSSRPTGEVADVSAVPESSTAGCRTAGRGPGAAAGHAPPGCPARCRPT